MLTMSSMTTTTATTITTTMTMRVVPENSGEELLEPELLETVMMALLFSVTPL
jgi:hypothetical protein